MIARNCTVEDLEKALVIVNERYHGNVCWNRSPEIKGKTIHFTLRVRSSKGLGHGRGNAWGANAPKRTCSACWHVHGHFFEAVFAVNPNATVFTSRSGLITKDGGNWQDYNVGSVMYPMQASDKCDCYLHENEDADPVEVASSLA